MKNHMLRSWLIACLLSVPCLATAAEKTFRWTGGLGPWDDASRWETIDGTGEVPNNSDHTAMIGDNANGRVSLTSGVYRNVGRLWIASASVLEVDGGALYLGSTSGFPGAGTLAGHGEILISQPDATTHSSLSFYSGDIRFDSGGESLLGGGTVTLDMTGPVTSGYHCGFVGSDSYTLTNVDWLIHGKGTIRIPFIQRPYGVVRADVPGGTLLIDARVDGNLGFMEADNSILHFRNGNLLRQWKEGDPATGTLRVKNNGRIEALNRTIESGTLENITTGPNASGKFVLRGGTYLIGRTGQPVNVNGRLDFQDDYYHPVDNPSISRLYPTFRGPIHNTGEIHITGGDPSHSDYPGYVTFGDYSPGSPTTFTGGGKLFFHSLDPTWFGISGPSEIDRGLINADNRIEFTANQRMGKAFQNLAAGSIGVATPGVTLDLTGDLLCGIQNRGTLFAKNGGILRINRLKYEDPLYPGFDNVGGTVQVDGDGTENASRVEFTGGSGVYGGYHISTGGRVVNYGGRVLITGSGSLYADGWDQGHHFYNMTFEGASPQGEVELTPGIHAVWRNCTLKGTGYLKGGMLSVDSGALNGPGTLIMSPGTHPVTGQTYSAVLTSHLSLRYGPPSNTWPLENTLITSCFIQGTGRVSAKQVIFNGGGIVASGAGTLDLSGVASLGGNPLLRAENGGTLKLTPPPGGLVLPQGQTLARLGGTIQVNGIHPLVVENGAKLIAENGGSLIGNDGGGLIANDGGGLIANDGGSLIANDGGSLIANDGGGLIANDGGGLIANDGGGLIANDGAGIYATAQASLRASGAMQARSGSRKAKNITPGVIHIRGGGLLAPSSNVNGEVPPQDTPGQINAEGDTVFDPGGMLQCEIGGTAPGTGYDQTNISGNVTFDGLLMIRILGNFGAQLNSGMSFTVLTGTSISGTPENAGAGRIATIDGLGSFRFTSHPTAFVLDDFQPTPGLTETYADFSATHDLAGLAHDDDDGDGLKNFAEYAFGTDPNTPGLPPTAVEETIHGQQWLVIHYTRRAARTLAGLSIVAQQSPDLAAWTTEGVIDEPDPTVISPEPNTDPRRARILKHNGSAFLRLLAATP